MAKLNEYFNYKSYFILLKTTKKWKELYCGHVCVISCILSIILITVIIRLTYIINYPKLADMLVSIDIALFPALIGLLGFLIAGIALLASVITDKALIVLDKQNIVETFVDLLFSFYFIGSILGITIFLLIVDYFLLKIPQDTYVWFFIVMLCITIYLMIYSILYTIALLGTCINTFFANIFLTFQKK